MAATLADIHDLAVYGPFVRRVTAAVVQAARTVGAENFDGTAYRIARRALSVAVFAETDLWGQRFSWGVAAHPMITANSTDGDIESSVTGLWDALAGAFQQA